MGDSIDGGLHGTNWQSGSFLEAEINPEAILASGNGVGANLIFNLFY